MNIFGDRGVETASAWLRGLSRRQEAISNNIANIDTPGYTRQEAPFESELRRALGTGPSQLATTDPRHIRAGTGAHDQLGVQATQLLNSARRDGNDVDVDQEMVLLAETQMRYQAAASALSTKISILREILRG
jgi:flagellar basal-body rod protein FlgB